MKKLILAFALIPFYIGLASAAEKTTQVQVTLEVLPNVTVTSTDLNFGQIEAGNRTSESFSVSVTASSGVNYKIAIGGGNNPQNGTTSNCKRRMADGNGHYVEYRVGSATPVTQYGDSCLASPTYSCGDNTGTGSVGGCISGTGTGNQQDYYIEGDTTPPASTPPGTYTDTLLITVLY